MKSFDGYLKKKLGDSYVLLAGGGHKAESSLSVNYALSAGNADTLDGYHEVNFFRYRGPLYQNHDYNANTLKIGEYIFRSSAYGSVGTGASHANVLNENSTIQVFQWLQMSATAWSDSMSYRLSWGGETSSNRPNGWSPWITFLSSSNYTGYVNPKATSKTIWGQTYIDASGNFQNVSGNLDISNYDILGYGGARVIQNLSGNLGINPLYNVGIGTTSPQYKLDVNGTGKFNQVHIYDGTNALLYLKTASSDAYAYLAAYNTGGTYGADIVLHSGSAMVLGAGESAEAMYSNNIDSLRGNENLYLTADNSVKIFTNCDSIENRRHIATFSNDGYAYFHSYIHIGGHEKNASSPTYVWGSNSSDSYLRSYQTSSLSVGYASSAGIATVWKRTWERNNNCAIDIPSSETRVYMADSSTANKPCNGAGFIIGHGWDWGYGGAMIYQDFDGNDGGRLYTNSRQCNGSWQGWHKIAFSGEPQPANGGTATNLSGGYVNVRSNSYYGSGYGVNMNNSDIIGVNSIYTANLSDSWDESFHWARSNGNWDTFRMADGTAYFTSNSGAEKDEASICSATTNLYAIYANRLHGGNNNNLWLQSANNIYITPSSTSTNGNNCFVFSSNCFQIRGGTTGTMNYSTSAPRIVFSENGTQAVGICYTDWDAYRPSKGLKVMDTNNDDIGNVWLEVQGCVYASHFYENSDIRYKRILKNLLINSNIIANLPLFDFEWIENNTIGTGTSAQAVQEILPNIVSGTDKLTLDYGVLGTIAGITACKELVTQKSEIEQLKEKVKQLEDKLLNYKNNLL